MADLAGSGQLTLELWQGPGQVDILLPAHDSGLVLGNPDRAVVDGHG